MTEILVAIRMVGIVACAVVALEGLARAPAVVAGVILIYAGASTILDPGAILTFGSITIYVPDIIYGLTAGAGFIRILGFHRLSFPRSGLVVIIGLALFSVARGAVEDFAGSVNEFRLMFYFLSGALYFVTVEPTKDFLDRVTYIFYAAALLTFGGALVLWAATLTGASLPELIPDPHEYGFRVVHATRAMVLAQACLIALPAWRLRHYGKRVFERSLVLIFIPAILLLQWKVVWILFLVGLVITGSRVHTLRRKLLVPVIATLVVSFLASPIIFAGRDSPSLEESLKERTNADTFLWRVEGWRYLLDNNGPQSISEVFLGAPYGRGWRRIVDEKERTTQPHSFYLDNYLRHGLTGLIVLVLIYSSTIRRLRTAPVRGSPSGLANPSMLLVLIVTQLIFFITFSAGAEQGLIAGLAIAVAIKSRSTGGVATPSLVTESDRVTVRSR